MQRELTLVMPAACYLNDRFMRDSRRIYLAMYPYWAYGLTTSA